MCGTQRSTLIGLDGARYCGGHPPKHECPGVQGRTPTNEIVLPIPAVESHRNPGQGEHLGQAFDERK